MNNKSSLLINLIGENGINRIEEFKKYKDGWDGKNGKKLNPDSVESMMNFVNSGYIYTNNNKEISVFLMHDTGNIGFENDGPISIEFLPNNEIAIENIDTIHDNITFRIKFVDKSDEKYIEDLTNYIQDYY